MKSKLVSKIKINNFLNFYQKNWYLSFSRWNTRNRNNSIYLEKFFNFNIVFDFYLNNFNIWRTSHIDSDISYLLNLDDFYKISQENNFLTKNKIKLNPLFIDCNVSLINVINSRKSYRCFNKEKLSFLKLSKILNTVFEKNNIKSGLKKKFNKNYASAGGFYKIFPVIYVINVEKIKKGFYIYKSKYLYELIIDGKNPKIEEILYVKNFENKNFSFILFFIFDTELPYAKYGNASLMFNLIEVGYISQLLTMVSNSLSIGTCDIGSYNKVFLEKILLIEKTRFHIIHSMVFGNIND